MMKWMIIFMCCWQSLGQHQQHKEADDEMNNYFMCCWQGLEQHQEHKDADNEMNDYYVL